MGLQELLVFGGIVDRNRDRDPVEPTRDKLEAIIPTRKALRQNSARAFVPGVGALRCIGPQTATDGRRGKVPKHPKQTRVSFRTTPHAHAPTTSGKEPKVVSVTATGGGPECVDCFPQSLQLLLVPGEEVQVPHIVQDDPVMHAALEGSQLVWKLLQNLKKNVMLARQIACLSKAVRSARQYDLLGPSRSAPLRGIQRWRAR